MWDGDARHTFGTPPTASRHEGRFFFPMKTTFPEDSLPGWAMPEAAVLYFWSLSEFQWQERHGTNLPFQTNSYKMKAFCRKAYNDMARKKNPNSQDTVQGGQAFTKRDPIRWVNISLSDDDSSHLAEANFTVDGLAADFVALTLSGWDVSLKRQPKDGSYSATAIGDDPFTPSGGVGISGWSDNPIDALAGLLYKINYKLEEGIPAPSERASRRFR